MGQEIVKSKTGWRDHKRPDHPVMIKINENVGKVRIHVRTDHCLGIRMRAQEMNTDEQMVRQVLGTDKKIFLSNSYTELLNLCRNQLKMMGSLSGHWHLQGHLFVLGLVGSYGCDRCKEDLKQPHMFFVNVRHWWYKD